MARYLLIEKKVDLIIGYSNGTIPLSTMPIFIRDEKDVDKLIFRSWLKLVHDLDFLYLIRNNLVKILKFNLKGLKVAVHYGCHYLNLERDKRTIEGILKNSCFRDKTKLEDLIKLFRGVPVDYQEKESCCRWGASQIVIHEKDALKITYKKLRNTENAKADLILMPCPTCLYTLSKPEFRGKINKWYGEHLDIPTIHINELIAILRGCEEDRCVHIRRNDPRIHEIYNIITHSSNL